MQRVFVGILFMNSIFFNIAFTNAYAGGEEKWDPPSAGPHYYMDSPALRGTFNSEGHYDSLTKGDKKYQYQEQLFMQYGLTDKLGTDLMAATSGGGSYDHGYGVNLTKKLKPCIVHADAIYSFPLERKVDGAKIRYGRYLNYDFGVEYFLPKGFNLMFEFNGFLQGDKIQDGEKFQFQTLTIFRPHQELAGQMKKYRRF